jgi:hypothetical protein
MSEQQLFEMAIKYGSNITVAAVLLWVVRSLYAFLQVQQESYNKLVGRIMEMSNEQIKQNQINLDKIEIRAQDLIDGERERFEKLNNYERSFFLELIEEKDATIDKKEDKLNKLIFNYLENDKSI